METYFWLLLAITLTPITELIIYRLVTSVIESSPLTELGKEFIRILVMKSIKGIKESLWMMIVSYLFYFLFFILSLHFYRHEKNFIMKLV